jgi:hypothetical protein
VTGVQTCALPIFQYEEKSVHSKHNKATENDASFDKAGTNK